MRGWEVKPLGWIILMIIIAGLVYAAYRGLVYLQHRQIPGGSSDLA